MRNELHMQRLYESGHTLRETARIDDPELGPLYGVIARYVAIIVAVALALCSRVVAFRLFGVVAALACTASVVWMGVGSAADPKVEFVQTMIMLAVPVGIVVASFVLAGRSGTLAITPSRGAIALLLLCAPVALAFGTNNNYWHWGSARASFFWVAGGLVLAAGVLDRRRFVQVALVAALAVQFITMQFAQWGRSDPYRQVETIDSQRAAVDINTSGASLAVGGEAAAYIDGLRTDAQISGYQPGTPVLDVTGQSPGLIYALGGTAVGRVWFPGGYYDGVERAAAGYVSLESCTTLARAWVLWEPTGQRRLDTEFLHNVGIDIPRGYVPASIRQRPRTTVTSHPPLTVLLRPTRTTDAAVSACERARSAAKRA
jgi:hypothetical protein